MARNIVSIALLFISTALLQAETIKIVVWDEQQPSQKEAYDNFLGNEIASYLGKQDGLSARSVNLTSPEQGIADNVLDSCDVLIWWGHIRQSEITQVFHECY